MKHEIKSNLMKKRKEDRIKWEYIFSEAFVENPRTVWLHSNSEQFIFDIQVSES